MDTGGSLSPDEAFLLRRRLETLPLRVRRACSTASVFAAALSGTRPCSRIDYPGCPSTPGTTWPGACSTRARKGALRGDCHGDAARRREAGLAFADKLRLSELATSLGGTHTLVSHVASTTHRQLDDRALRGRGIDPGAGRFSIGLGGPRRPYFDALCRPGKSSAGRAWASSLPALRAGRTEDAWGSAGSWVAVVFGGRSTEHAVSCASAGLILSAIDHDRYEGAAHRHRHRRPVGAHLGRPGPACAVLRVRTLGRVGGRGGGEIVSRAVLAGLASQVMNLARSQDLGAVDVVLPLLHGA